MGRPHWTKTWRSWEGSLDELVGALAEVAEQEPWLEHVPNPRLIRHYTKVGVIDKPVRNGRTAQYGFRSILQYLVARWLLHDGWPLSKIAEVTATRSDHQLRTMLPTGSRSPRKRSSSVENEAMSLIRQLKRGGADTWPRKSGAGPAQQSLLRSLHMRHTLQTRERVQLELNEHLHVLIDTHYLQSITPKEIRALGTTLASAIEEAKRRSHHSLSTERPVTEIDPT